MPTEVTQARETRVQRNHRQLMGVMVGSWITIMLAVLGLYFKG